MFPLLLRATLRTDSWVVSFTFIFTLKTTNVPDDCSYKNIAFVNDIYNLKKE